MNNSARRPLPASGSYNWSHQTQQNSENITVISNYPELAGQFIQEFESNFERHSGKGVAGADLGKIVARLEALRQVIALNDGDDISLQLAKLKKLLTGGDEYAEVNEIIARIEADQIDQAFQSRAVKPSDIFERLATFVRENSSSSLQDLENH